VYWGWVEDKNIITKKSCCFFGCAVTLSIPYLIGVIHYSIRLFSTGIIIPNIFVIIILFFPAFFILHIIISGSIYHIKHFLSFFKAEESTEDSTENEQSENEKTEVKTEESKDN